MRLVVEMMAGGKVHLFHIPPAGAAFTVQSSTAAGAQGQASQTVQVQVETQLLRFQAKGTVVTSDGRQIDFQAELALSRQFSRIGTGGDTSDAPKDPLVLNFDGRGARLLAGQTVKFDLNGDGQAEALPLVAPGTGILFDDKNGDGRANDGTELFGPLSGDGFGELSSKDTDHNGWIDQGDPVFGELRVWFPDSSGPGKVYSLADLGVGAISTANVETPFDLRTGTNALLGQIRSSGVYLQQDGQAGVVSHVDLAV